MDWVRLRGSGVDLAGTKGVVTPVTLAELKKHNKKNDAWMAIRGKVYNVTRYMDFHPGGVEELMKGVGMDATKLFDDVHAWVNYDQMLNKCYIGPLCATISSSSKIVSSTSSSQLNTGSSLAANFRLPFSISANNFITNPSSSSSSNSNEPKGVPSAAAGPAESNNVESPQTIPRFDWIQKTTELVIIFYTRAFCNPGLIIEAPEEDEGGVSLEVRVLIEGSNNFLVKFTLTESVQWPPCNVRNMIETGKIEITFTKTTPKLWSSYGTMEMTKQVDVELNEYEYDVNDCWPINHDSFALALRPKKKLSMYLPIGQHVSIGSVVGGQEINRSYTPVPQRFGTAAAAAARQQSPSDLLLLIKSYENGTLSKHLCKLSVPLVKDLRVSPPQGNFSLTQLKSHKRIAFLAAGSGLTPFLGIIDHVANKTNNQV